MEKKQNSDKADDNERKRVTPAPGRSRALRRSSTAACTYSAQRPYQPVFVYIVTMKICFVEPIGGSKPKFSINTDTIIGSSHAQSKSLSLSCPAQGSPIPTFRLVLLY